jgi:DNA polymerase-3 subunit beta
VLVLAVVVSLAEITQERNILTMTMTPITPSLTKFCVVGSADTHASEETSLHLICKQPELAHALSLVNRAVLAHSTLPILTNILLVTDRGRLRLSATNLEIGIQIWIDAHILREGTTALPADLLTRTVNLMPHDAITLSVAQRSQTLKVECSGSVTNIRGKDDPREFPVLPGIQIEQQVAPCEIEAGLLKKMIEQVAFAAETNDVKPVLTAVCMQIGGGTLTFAAANTFRLAERVAPLAGTATSFPPVLVPARNLMELARILPSQGSVRMVVTPQQNQVVFHCEQGEHITFVSRLIQGVYPAYQRSIPREFPTRAVIETKQFAAAVGRAALFARDELKTVRLMLKGGEHGALFGTLTVEAEDADRGSHFSSMTAEVTGPQCCVIFPVRYLCEALERIETPQVALSVLGQGKPGVLKPVGEMQYLNLVMGAQERRTTTA